MSTNQEKNSTQTLVSAYPATKPKTPKSWKPSQIQSSPETNSLTKTKNNRFKGEKNKLTYWRTGSDKQGNSNQETRKGQHKFSHVFLD
jgi:hypothetical protein